MRTYQEDLDLFHANNIKTIELHSPDGRSRIVMVPAYQGRVMTSTADGLDGTSYGWVNHRFISSGKINHKFNPFGGEERFWLGPEGGPDSWFFKKGQEQTFQNWKVPAAFDTTVFDLLESDCNKACFQKRIQLMNASGFNFDILMKRKVEILKGDEIGAVLGISPAKNLKAVAYRSTNSITNESLFRWDHSTAKPSIWMLGMFNPSENATVLIPYNRYCIGKILNDDYFGKTPSDRLEIENGIIHFKIDGKYRSKIGLPQGSAKDILGSYDAGNGILTLLKYSQPKGPAEYVNSRWGVQEERYEGDVINSYNDGPTEDGTVMGPFYEIETSSPAAELDPGETLEHCQYTFHLQGDRKILERIIRKLF